MGQNESKPSYHNVTNDSIDVFEYDSAQSYLVSYGIDLQTSPKYNKHKTLSSIVGEDAKLIRNSLVDIGAFEPQNTAVYIGSKQTDDCTFAGIKRTFQEAGAKVGPNGLLIFHFSGHGISRSMKIKDECYLYEYYLVPVDFDRSLPGTTGITASDLISWINEVQCKAKYILFTLDCCYAGGMGEQTKYAKVEVDAKICVMSACAGYETSLSIDVLKNSVFAYFLCDSISKCRFQAGLFPIKEIFSRCQACCQTFVSLMLKFNGKKDIDFKKDEEKRKTPLRQIQRPELTTVRRPELTTVRRPELTTVRRPLEGVDEIDVGTDEVDGDMVNGPAIGRFEYAFSLYDDSLPQPPLLSETTCEYIENVSNMDKGPLLELQEKCALTDLVLVAAVCSMVYSVASSELQSHPQDVANPNHFIIAFVNCVAAVDKIEKGIEVSKRTFFESLLFYHEVLRNRRSLNISGLESLIGRLNPCVQGEQESTDFTDSDDSSYLHGWTPMEPIP